MISLDLTGHGHKFFRSLSSPLKLDKSNLLSSWAGILDITSLNRRLDSFIQLGLINDYSFFVPSHLSIIIPYKGPCSIPLKISGECKTIIKCSSHTPEAIKCENIGIRQYCGQGPGREDKGIRRWMDKLWKYWETSFVTSASPDQFYLELCQSFPIQTDKSNAAAKTKTG